MILGNMILDFIFSL